MSASVRIVVLDHDGPGPELTYVVDNLDSYGDAVDTAVAIAATHYSQTGIVPTLPDGTPFWGESDENGVNT